jgi:hypothetical protein
MKNAGSYAGVFVCSFDCNVVDCLRDWEGVYQLARVIPDRSVAVPYRQGLVDPFPAPRSRRSI